MTYVQALYVSSERVRTIVWRRDGLDFCDIVHVKVLVWNGRNYKILDKSSVINVNKYK